MILTNSSGQQNYRAERNAREIFRSGKTALGLTAEMVQNPKQLRGDLRRSAIAWAIWTKTSGVTQWWIAADALKPNGGVEKEDS